MAASSSQSKAGPSDTKTADEIEANVSIVSKQIFKQTGMYLPRLFVSTMHAALTKELKLYDAIDTKHVKTEDDPDGQLREMEEWLGQPFYKWDEMEISKQFKIAVARHAFQRKHDVAITLLSYGMIDPKDMMSSEAKLTGWLNCAEKSWPMLMKPAAVRDNLAQLRSMVCVRELVRNEQFQFMTVLKTRYIKPVVCKGHLYSGHIDAAMHQQELASGGTMKYVGSFRPQMMAGATKAIFDDMKQRASEASSATIRQGVRRFYTLALNTTNDLDGFHWISVVIDLKHKSVEVFDSLFQNVFDDYKDLAIEDDEENVTPVGAFFREFQADDDGCSTELDELLSNPNATLAPSNQPSGAAFKIVFVGPQMQFSGVECGMYVIWYLSTRPQFDTNAEAIRKGLEEKLDNNSRMCKQRSVYFKTAESSMASCAVRLLARKNE